MTYNLFLRSFTELFQIVFFADPFMLQEITTDPYVLARVDIECPEAEHAKLKN
jgi:hypothetical protein